VNEQILFDRLRYIDKLKGAGIGEDQARAHADAIDEALREAVATKSDIAALKSDFASLAVATRSDIAALAAAAKHDLAALESKIDLAVRDMTIRSGTIAAAIVGILATIKFFG
jgi:conjugal transfer/entry exclusion protein